MKSSEILIREYVSEFMEKVYYFCLKKTGSPDGAQDLAQDISLGIISSLSNTSGGRRATAMRIFPKTGAKPANATAATFMSSNFRTAKKAPRSRRF